MKKINLFLIPALAFSLSCGPKAQAQTPVLPFSGTIQYRIAYESPIVPQEQLAQQPQTATLRMGTDKAVFAMAEQKALADATTKELHSLVNLSAMGLGKYHLTETEADLQMDVEEKKNLTVEKTQETKTISGYTAHQAKAFYKQGNTSIELAIWYVEGFGDPFFNHATQAGSLDGVDGFPLEYAIKTPDMTMTFTVHKLTNEEVNPKYFNIPSSYKASTKEQMTKDIQEFMQSMRDMQGMGM